MRISLLALGLFGALRASPASAQVTIFDDTATGPRTSALSLDPTERFAKPFVATASGIVTSVTLEVAGVVGVGTGSFTIELHADGGGDPGALIGSGSGMRSPSSGPGSITVSISGSPTLALGTTYYAVFYANAGNWMAWYHSSTTTEAVRHSLDGGGSWAAATGTDARRPGLRVTGGTPGPDGAPCTGPALCVSGRCVDAVCCATDCAGGDMDCQACSIAAGGSIDGACTALRAPIAATTTCRPPADSCDVAEVCSASDLACPADVFASPGATCRGATGACDVAETCTGASASCPSDARSADGTSCGDALVCNGDEVCAAGACAPGAALGCDDGDPCTADACAEPDGCASVPIPSCGADAASSDAGELDAGSSDASARVDGGARDGGARVDGGAGPTSGGCSCAAPGATPARGYGPALALAVVLVLKSRRRRA